MRRNEQCVSQHFRSATHMSDRDPFPNVRNTDGPNVLDDTGMHRREFLRLLGGAAAAAGAVGPAWAAAAESGADAAANVPSDGGLSELRFPEKAKLIVRTDRPPNLEM